MESFSVIIPAFNEELTISQIVKTSLDFCKNVVVVDDGSSDETAKNAELAGAKVFVLPSNQGKGAAIYYALKNIDTEYVIMLDADLQGLNVEHLEQLAKPVADGSLDMSIGIFDNKELLTRWGNRLTPNLSGQRATKTSFLLSVPNLENEKWPEPAITEHIKNKKLRFEYIDLANLNQIVKEKKRGFAKGAFYRMLMYKDILKRLLK